MIRGVLVGGEKIVAKVESMGGRLQVEMRNGVARAALKVLRHTVANKLQGQVLKAQSSRLQRSINASPVEDSEGVLLSRVGTNVEYGRTHEYGFNGSVPVREHLRKTKSGGMANVRAHTRNVNLPVRSFLRSALADMEPAIRAEFQAAAQRASKL